MKKLARVLIATFAVVGLFALPASRAGASPSNDDIADAKVIQALPYTDVSNLDGSGREFGEPSNCSYEYSVWYEYTPSEDQVLQAIAEAPENYPVVAVFEEELLLNSFSRPVACDYGSWDRAARASWYAGAGHTFYIRVATYESSEVAFTLRLQPPPPPNDSFENATVITAVPFEETQEFGSLSRENNEPSDCSWFEDTLWYKYASPSNQNLVVDVETHSYLSGIAVYEADNFTKSVACKREYTSAVTVDFPALANKTYYFQAAGDFYAGGVLAFRLSGPPANDDKSSATIVSGVPFSFKQNTTLATLEAGEPQPCGAIGSTVWYSYTPQTDEMMVATTEGSRFDTVVALHEAASPDSALACNDDNGGSQSSLGMVLVGGNEYLFQFGGWYGDAGSLELSIQTLAGRSGNNDYRTEAHEISSLPFSYSRNTDGAFLDSGEVLPCGLMGATVWYRYTAPRDEVIRAETLGSTFDTVLSVYESADLGTALDCNDDYEGKQGGLEVSAEQGATYYFQVGGWKGNTGDLEFNLSIAPEPPADTAWADPETAVIRPGMRISIDGTSSCTASFVFRGNGIRAGRIYLATLARCAEMNVGAPVRLDSSEDSTAVIGRVAYSSWKERGVNSQSGDIFCLIEECPNSQWFFGDDLALIEINDAYRDNVSPSMFGFGGPTGIIPFDDVRKNDKVLAFANSSTNPEADPLDPREGYVMDKWNSSTVVIQTVVPITSGSGIPVILGDGRALGQTNSITIGTTGTTGVVSLERVLSYARMTGWSMELGVVQLDNPGILPTINQ